MTTTRKRVLLVEDETLIAMLLEDILDELGYDVAGSAADFDEGMRLASSETFDLAILDVNVGGREIFPIAEQLAARDIPFMFSTGYGAYGLPEEWKIGRFWPSRSSLTIWKGHYRPTSLDENKSE
ncbi:response regulator [Pseudomonas luteola]|uniref:response regulator n=1 Tax=Pseudomonas luteola TaxID=47886 RepID=UPI002F263FC7